MAGVLFTEVSKLVPLYEQARSNDDVDRSVVSNVGFIFWHFTFYKSDLVLVIWKFYWEMSFFCCWQNWISSSCRCLNLCRVFTELAESNLNLVLALKQQVGFSVVNWSFIYNSIAKEKHSYLTLFYNFGLFRTCLIWGLWS